MNMIGVCPKCGAEKNMEDELRYKNFELDEYASGDLFVGINYKCPKCGEDLTYGMVVTVKDGSTDLRYPDDDSYEWTK